jgi:hypothetical protein
MCAHELPERCRCGGCKCGGGERLLGQLQISGMNTNISELSAAGENRSNPRAAIFEKPIAIMSYKRFFGLIISFLILRQQNEVSERISGINADFILAYDLASTAHLRTITSRRTTASRGCE